MSTMDEFGLPEPVVDIILKQKDVEGLELGWTISGGVKGVELKLTWRPTRGPSKDTGPGGRKYKSPGNMKRDYYRMKRMLTELNSIAVGTEDLVSVQSDERHIGSEYKNDVNNNIMKSVCEFIASTGRLL